MKLFPRFSTAANQLSCLVTWTNYVDIKCIAWNVVDNAGSSILQILYEICFLSIFCFWGAKLKRAATVNCPLPICNISKYQLFCNFAWKFRVVWVQNYKERRVSSVPCCHWLCYYLTPPPAYTWLATLLAFAFSTLPQAPYPDHPTPILRMEGAT